MTARLAIHASTLPRRRSAVYTCRACRQSILLFDDEPLPQGWRCVLPQNRKWDSGTRAAPRCTYMCAACDRVAA